MKACQQILLHQILLFKIALYDPFKIISHYPYNNK